MQSLIVMRGLPGAGKTSWLAAHHPYAAVFGGDRWFVRVLGGRYDPRRVAEAHAFEQAAAIRALGQGARLVALDNTHSRRWEWAVVAAAAEAIGDVTIRIVDCYDGRLDDAALAARCVHGVPATAIAEMRRRWER